MGLDPDAVRLELYAYTMDGSEPQRHAMAQGRALGGWDGGHEYAASVPATPRLGTIHRGWYRITPRRGCRSRPPRFSGNDDHGDMAMTTTTTGTMGGGPLSRADCCSTTL